MTDAPTADAPLQDAPSPAQTVEVSPEDARKSGEKLLDHLKLDAERASADMKSAEDRARANATLAAGAIPLVTFMRTMVETPTLLQNVLAIAVLVVVIVILSMLVGLTRVHKTERTTVQWYKKRQEDIYYEREEAGYDRFLHELQSMWVGYLEDGRRVRDDKFAWYEWQHWGLLLLMILLSVLAVTLFL